MEAQAEHLMNAFMVKCLGNRLFLFFMALRYTGLIGRSFIPSYKKKKKT